MKTMLLFFGGAVLLAAVGCSAAYAIWGSGALVQASVAWGVSFVPASATLALVMFGFRSTPHVKLLAAWAGSGIRMGVAGIGGYLVTRAWPELFTERFWDWLILFYLMLLGLEISLLVYAFRASPAPPGGVTEAAARSANHDSRGNA